MNTNPEEQELKDRLSLIETMIAEGRRTTESWGWTFVLWGVAYYVAIAWSTWGRSTLAWPVTMIAAGILTGVFGSRIKSGHPETTVGRAMLAIWLGMGISTFIIMLSLGFSGRMDLHIAIAIIGAMLGAANATSSIILKWKMQFAFAVIWWTAGAVSCFISENQAGILFLVAIFFCQIVFGFYGMIAESRKRKASGNGQEVSHA
jgi:fatty acid desaturase